MKDNSFAFQGGGKIDLLHLLKGLNLDSLFHLRTIKMKADTTYYTTGIKGFLRI